MLRSNKAGRFTILRPDFSFDLKNLLKIKSFFSESLKEIDKGVLLDLSHVDSIDSVGYRSIHNLFSSLKKNQVGMLVYSDAKEVVDQFKKVSPDIQATENQEEAFQIALRSSCTDAWMDIELECPICGNREFPKRALNRENLKVYWKEGALLPQYTDLITGKPVDIYQHGFIVCCDCLLTSLYHTDFIHTFGGQRMSPVFTFDAKTLLIRSTNRRKDILSKIGIEPPDFKAFLHNPGNLDTLYRLCADCVASTSFDRSLNRFWEQGLTNLLVFYYQPDDKKDRDFLDKADMAFKDCAKFRPDDGLDKVWQSFYYRTLITVVRQQLPACSAIFDAFRKEKEPLPKSEYALFEFWYNQALKVHRQAISDVANRSNL